MKKLLYVSLCISILVGLGAGPALGADKIQIQIGSWGTVDASYFLAGAIANVLNKGIPEVNAIVVPSGTARNYTGMEDGKMEMGWIQSESLHFGPIKEAGGPFKEGEVYKKARVLLYLAPAIQQFIVLDDSPIKTIDDVRGIKCAVMSPASLNPAVFPLAAHGIKKEENKWRFMRYGPQADALKDGNLDVAMISTLIPSPSVMQLAKERKIRFIPFEPEKIYQATRDYPWNVWDVIPKDTYGKGVPAEDYTTFGQLVVLGVTADLPEDLVYRATKLLVENRKEIETAHVQGRVFNVANQQYWIDHLVQQFPYHPGAKKYLAEQGVKFKN
jgi:hypothetical protein